MSIVNIARFQTLRLIVNVFPCLLPSNVVRPCTPPRTIASHLKRFLANYEAPLCKRVKTAETESTSKQESSKIYESTQRKINPSWKESFSWFEYHVENKEGKMFCFVCRRYDRSRSFCVGSMNFKLQAIKAHARSDSHKQNQKQTHR